MLRLNVPITALLPFYEKYYLMIVVIFYLIFPVFLYPYIFYFEVSIFTFEKFIYTYLYIVMYYSYNCMNLQPLKNKMGFYYMDMTGILKCSAFLYK